MYNIGNHIHHIGMNVYIRIPHGLRSLGVPTCGGWVVHEEEATGLRAEKISFI